MERKLTDEQLHLISCLSEECAEVSQEVSKCIRFGPDGLKKDGSTPIGRLEHELNDIMAVIDLLVWADVLAINWRNAEAQDTKRAKVLKYMASHGVHSTVDKPSEPC